MTERSASVTSQLVTPFREDGTFRLPLDLVPGRHRPRAAYKPPKTTGRLIRIKPPVLPDERGWDRGRQLALIGDPLADDLAALYPKLGHARARSLLDAALERGIENVPDAPAALVALVEEVDRPPSWVDWDRVERGAAAMRRYAPLTWMFARLAFAQTYVNANAGTPLYMTGSLREQTVVKRLKETDRWRLGLQQAGALRRGGDAFKTVVRVRVLHALIRLHILTSGKWDIVRLGMPIPQLDMAGANIGMYMTHSVLLRSVGAIMTPREMGDVLHLWRYHGHLIGVLPELNPVSEEDVQRIGTLITATTRIAFDERAPTLTRSTLTARLREDGGLLGKVVDYVDVRVSHGLYHLTNGPELYRKMNLEDGLRWLWFLPAIFPPVFVADTLRRLTPGGTRLADYLGGLYIDRIMQADEVKNAPFRPYPAPA